MSPPASSPLRPPLPHPDLSRLVRRHLSFGGWSLLVFLVLGIGLEALHGFKVPWYLNDAYSARRLLWTLAHAHGVLLALINVVFANRIYKILHGELVAVGAQPGRVSNELFDLARPTLDWIKLAEGMGVEGVRVETLEGFADAFKAANARHGPFLIEFRI